jgi:SAM-dependent methyltransferase
VLLRLLGCGTGLALKLLKQAPAFEHVDGMDISAEMLQEAAKLNLYESLFEGDLDATLDVESATYNAIVCVGTFTHGHVGPHGIRELLRATKVGGCIVLSVNEGVWESDAYEAALDTLQSERLCEVVSAQKTDYLRDTACEGYTVVLTRS